MDILALRRLALVELVRHHKDGVQSRDSVHPQLVVWRASSQYLSTWWGSNGKLASANCDRHKIASHRAFLGPSLASNVGKSALRGTVLNLEKLCQLSKIIAL